MGLVAKTGRKSLQTRLLLSGIFLALLAGAVTMVVPFLVMLSGSTRTGVDQSELSLYPSFLREDDALYRKYIDGLYNESPSLFRSIWRVKDADFSQVVMSPEDAEALADWRAFVETYPVELHERYTGFTATPQSRGRPLNVRRYLRVLHDEMDGEILQVNAAFETAFRDWNAFRVLPLDTRTRQGLHPDTAWWRSWEAYTRKQAPEWSRMLYDLQGYYRERVIVPLKGREAPEEPLSVVAPADAESLEQWEVFVRGVVHPGYVRISSEAASGWHAFLEARYVDVATLEQITGVVTGSFAELTLPESVYQAGPLSADWADWLQGWQREGEGIRYEAPLHALRLQSVDLAWRAKTGKAPPAAAWNRAMFEEHREDIRRAFLFQNYGTVWEILILHGRGLWVTVIYCGGAVLIALIVNPMAAYALSRFRPKRTYAFLLYLLLTMAFPPMVTQIPVFLMMRDFQLLNTFWALLLPGMAHGYSIFLLKGFFDSLPRELYESASMDGAGEFRMFGTITLSLSKPILAVIALSAFVNAYSSFMFALLICQEEDMWTLMVWLYQLQQQYGAGVLNAAFVLAAVPTLIAFLAAQRQILRGIVVPTEK